MTLAAFAGSAIQLGFFVETRSEVEWGAAGSFVGDKAAIRLLLSGIRSVVFAGAAILVISWMLGPRLHSMTGNLFLTIRRSVYESWKSPRTLLPFATCPKAHWNLRVLIPTVAVTVSLIVLQATRPRIPYNHISAPLPFTMLEIFHLSSTYCRVEPLPFPFPDLISTEHWEKPKGLYPGWEPGQPSLPDANLSRPTWLPEPVPAGFHRWLSDPSAHRDEHGIRRQCSDFYQLYDPVRDPLKISNLDLDVLPELREVFKEHSVEINHVVLFFLESERKEVFPMQASTPLFDEILETHEEYARPGIIDKLSQLTPIAQIITDEWALTSKGEKNNFTDAIWKDHSASQMGGINVKGAVTPSTLTFKSLLSSHCGVNPLPVNLLDEVHYEIYQPCLPHIFDLFNQIKAPNSSELAEEKVEKISEKFQERPWKSVFIQAVTDSYDRQKILNRKIGFKRSIVRETLQRPSSKYYPPKTPEINYFGYAESEIEPYIQDIIMEAGENRTRLFLSHITSTTHHPWGLPAKYQKESYLGSKTGRLSKHEDLNNYLNTVAYCDEWLGKVLGFLDEAKIADSTLVVIMGDHGTAFIEDFQKTGTFLIPHISTLRVPLVFRHPRLPRIEISANVTSLSILPTILDLLVQTNSLDEKDTSIASELIHQYQGQSIIRPFKSEHKGRQAWNVGIINAGGKMISVTSAAAPYRLILPLTSNLQYRFTHVIQDPGEHSPIEAWSLDSIRITVMQKYGKKAASWLTDAASFGNWWVAEQKRVWNYHR